MNQDYLLELEDSTTDMYVRLTFTYEDGSTRMFDLPVYDSAVFKDIKTKVLAINASADDTFKSFFVSDDGEKFSEISAASYRLTIEEKVW